MQLLERDATVSSNALAKELGMSPATVRRRIAGLIENNVVRIIAVVDPSKVGFPLAAIISLEVDLEKQDLCIQALNDRPEVRWLSTNTGRSNVVAVAQFVNTDELADFTENQLAKIEGIKHFETSIILRREKAHYVLGVL